MEKETKDIKRAVIAIILAILCLMTLGYIIYIRVNKENKEKPIDPIVDNEPEKEEKPIDPIKEPEEIKITKNEVQKLYETISKFPEFRLYTKVTYETLTPTLKDQVILNKLRPDFECTDDIKINKSEFLQTHISIFNSEKSESEGICSLDNEIYDCYIECTDEIKRNVNKYLEYEITEDMVVIYEKYGYLDYLDDGVIYLKESIDDTNTITTFTNIEDIKVESLESKLPTYKHTFKISNGNYYWFSSEIVKQ